MFRLGKTAKEEMRLDWKSRYFRKSFILILFITSIPGIVFGVGFYGFGVVQVEEELRDIHENQINQRAANIDDQFDYLEVSLSHWAFEPRFNETLLELDYVENFQETRDIVQKLLILKGSHPLIKQVRLFVDAEDPILFSPHYGVISEQEEYDKYHSVLTERQHVHWTSLYDFGSSSVALTHNIPGNSRTPFGTIIVTMDEYKMTQLLKTLTPYDAGVTLMMNENKQTLVSSNSTNYSNFENALKEEVQEQKAGANESFTMEWEGETYSVSSGQMDRIDSEWLYVSAAPISSITSPIVFISNLIIIISLSLLVIAFIMAWFASNRIYSPVRKLLQVLGGEEGDSKHKQDEFEMIKEKWVKLSNESESLQQRLSAQIPQLKQSFLLQLTRGYLYEYSEAELRSRMKNYDWNIEDHKFLIMDVQLTGIYESEIILENDESLVTFAMANIMEESARNYFEQFTTINYHDLSVGMLIITPSSNNVKDDLYLCAENITNAVNDILKLQVTVTLSQSADQVKRIPYLFEEVSQGKRYRNFENQNQLIDLQEQKKESNHVNVYYPFEIEKEIVQAVRRGQINEAKQLTREFLEELTFLGMKEINIQSGMMQLFGTIQKEILHSGIQPNDLFKGRNMFAELTQIRESEWMVEWIVEEVISPYVNILQGRMDFETKRMVEQVVEEIQSDYMKDISLESYADIVGTNPYTLSKAFKRVLGVNFIDYVTTVRMDKAKELLLNTNMKVNEVSEKVGYRHSYFNRIFKKNVGVTPGQYRRLKSSS
ncbi:helix-turn-helix transcriptional regulator [Salibacterium salarium]|nr:AraC family transcriptional regulator [Salibacterium salarium]